MQIYTHQLAIYTEYGNKGSDSIFWCLLTALKPHLSLFSFCLVCRHSDKKAWVLFLLKEWEIQTTQAQNHTWEPSVQPHPQTTTDKPVSFFCSVKTFGCKFLSPQSLVRWVVNISLPLVTCTIISLYTVWGQSILLIPQKAYAKIYMNLSENVWQY